MIAIKSYTDLSQSKKLAEFLPLETADMCFVGGRDNAIMTPYLKAKESLLASFCKADFMSPCWSLTALLDILPIIEKGKDIFNPFIAKTPDNGYYVVYATLTKEGNSSAIYDNPVDACYEIILKLHEQKLL